MVSAGRCEDAGLAPGERLAWPTNEVLFRDMMRPGENKGMQDEFREDVSPAPESNVAGEGKRSSPEPSTRDEALFGGWLRALLQMGLGESLLQAATTVLSVVAIALVIWLTQVFYAQARLVPGAPGARAAIPTTAVRIDAIPALANPALVGISRQARIHTNVPTRPRQDITTYTVQSGDSVFGIAEKFGLQPETILWSNAVLQDDPHLLQPDQELIILPVDGVYHEWLGGIPFGEWARYFKVEPADILEYPGNHIDTAAITDFENAVVPSGTWLIVPHGRREFVATWNAPFISRTDTVSARVMGPGWCDPVFGGAVGYGTYVWPTNKHYLSGYDYTPKANHWGIDLAGNEGEGVYAADAGVVVYSGWNNYGYGNMIMIDHGNGWQSLYAHLSATYRGCGASVGQGEGIGAIGSTGRSSGAHLHFELMTPSFKVNPWDYLPPP